uniref:DNA polymerase n=1 Tax=Fagus sylvatica TaxID=28930 RepID=A0A2N9I954_FAGSY
MADTQADSNVFSVRIVSIDYYMAAPISGLDFCYSSFQGGKVNEVPVIRIYGSTPTGQKTCLHIHKVLPYLYVPCADISLQPHKEGDAHTQAVFLALEKALKIDYNLYGMGHMHLSKMKFRHPVPDTFSPRKSDRIGLQNQKMDKLTCMANDFQNPNCDASLSSPIWISSTIPADWIWQFPSEFEASSHQDVCCVKRQSVCELEGDASIDDILNQQFKNYSSLSQTHSEVKMVQSLVPIWEEEYERTGMRDVAMPSDPSKPLPNDVLRTLSLGLEFESKLIELCGATENTLALNPLEKNVKLLQSMTSATDEGNLVGLGHTNPDNRDGESLKYSKEKDIMGSLSPQGSIREEEIPIEGRDTSIKPLSIDEMRTSAIIETLDPKATDEEALGLLRWLATSQAGEDINSDDELVRETILSPLLPATTIDKVLEKANMDYESESQKECQDILDSIDDLSDFEGLKEGASHCSDQNHSSISSSEKMIPQIDGSADDLFSVPCAGSTEKSSEIEMRSEFEGSFRVPVVAGCNCAGRFMKNADTDVHDLKESCTLVGCSVRDLMRRKRSYRVEPPDDGSGRTKKALLEGEQREGLLLGHKQLNDELDKNPIESLNLRQSLAGQQTNFQEAYEVKAAHSDSSMYGKLPLLYSSDSLSQASRLKDGNFGSHEKVGDEARIGAITGPVDFTVTGPSQVHTGPWICKPKTIDSAASMGHREIDNVKESGFGVTAIAIERFQQIGSVASSCLQTGMVECGVSGADCSMYESGHKDEPSLVWVHDKSFENLAGTNVTTDSMGLQNQNCSGGKQVGDFILSGFGSSETVVVNTQEKCTELIGMTFCKKPPIADWTDGASENASFTLTTSNPEEDNFGGSSGRVLDDFLPFFEGECREEKELMDKHARISDSNSDQVVIGVPTHCQNDGSYLYLLTPVLSPPSTDSVYRWLLCDEKGAPGGNNVASVDSSPLKGSASSLIGTQSFLPDDCDKDLPESGSGSHVKPILDHLYQENPRIFDREMSAFGDGVTTIMQGKGGIAKDKSCSESTQDMSQISGPDGKSKPTPLSQSGFRDPASVGGGQQLTLLSIEVQAESRGDLRPNPRFDAINVIALAIQNDTDSIPEVYVLLRSKTEAFKRSLDGTSGCKMLVFSEEKYLFSHFMKIVCSSDPDIIMGWDIQGGSLGFLAERASHLGIGLLNNISRTPSEIKIAAGDLDIPEKGNFDNLIPEQSNTDPVILEDAIIEDEWGRTHASGVHVGGRIVLNIWRLMRGEVKLNMYTIEAVAEAVLRRKIPSFRHKVLTKWFSSGPGRGRFRCIEYAMERARLNLEIMNQLDMINRTSELARVFGIDFFSVLSRGSQYRVESMLLRLAHTQNYLAISPGSQQVASQPAMECLPLVMEPESGFYADPVVVLDFQSLYPSMIIAYNLCFSTCLGNVAPSKANTLGVSSFSPDPYVLQSMKNEILLTPNGVMYVTSKQILHRVFNARQLALKLISNVTYGYTATGFSGRMPCAELADSIVQCGRSTLEKAISFVNAHNKWKAKVIYGDTDSLFVLLKGRTVKESFRIRNEIASAITAMNPKPVTLKMEKVYHPCFLLTKKRYVGYSYETPEQTAPVFDAKGIETVRRDTCGAVAKTLEMSLRHFFEHQDISEVPTVQGALHLSQPAAIVATKAMRADPRAEPCYAERIPYVVIHGEPGARLIDMVVDPLELLAMDSPFRLNDLYYINKQIIPALQRVFGLVGADLIQWHQPVYAINVCKKGAAAATAVIGRTSKLEREMQHLAAICRHCGGGDWVVESGVKCTSLACSVFHERRKVQKEL